MSQENVEIARREALEATASPRRTLSQRPPGRQAPERGPDLLLTLLVQDRLVLEPEHEGVKPEQANVDFQLACVGHQHLLGAPGPRRAVLKPRDRRLVDPERGRDLDLHDLPVPSRLAAGPAQPGKERTGGFLGFHAQRSIRLARQ